MSILPPHNDDAERAVLGAMLKKNEIISRVAALLRPPDFYNYAHQVIFNGLVELNLTRKQPVDPVTLSDYLQSISAVDDIGGYRYLVTLWESGPVPSSALYYAEIVANKSFIRHIMRWCGDVQRIAFERQGDIAELIEHARRGFDTIATSFEKMLQTRASFGRDAI
jgi:replicative DNA helicase